MMRSRAGTLRALALVQLLALLASGTSGALLDSEKTRCESTHTPKSSKCTGCPPTYNGKLCASTTRYNDQTKAACGCGKTDPIPENWWTLTQFTAALNCKNLDDEDPMKSWCPSGCGGCYELCSTGSTTNGGNKTEGGVCRVFKVTNRCGDGYKEYPMWCSNELTWRECRDNPERCRKKGSTNWYGYPAHFDLQDFHDQVSDELGWDNVEVTFEPVPCSRWKGPSWDCKCNSSDSLHSAFSATASSVASGGAAASASLTGHSAFSATASSVASGGAAASASLTGSASAASPASSAPSGSLTSSSVVYASPASSAASAVPATQTTPASGSSGLDGWAGESEDSVVEVLHTTVSPGYQQVALAGPPSPQPATAAAPGYQQATATAAPSPPLAVTLAPPGLLPPAPPPLGLQPPAAAAAAPGADSGEQCGNRDGEQCGGSGWKGRTCCNHGCTCKAFSISRSVCTPLIAGQSCGAGAPSPATAARSAAPLASQVAAVKPAAVSQGLQANQGAVTSQAPLPQQQPAQAPAATAPAPRTTARPSQAPAASGDCGKAYEQCGGPWTRVKCCRAGCRCASPPNAGQDGYRHCRPIGQKPVCEASQEAAAGPSGASGASTTGAAGGASGETDLLGAVAVDSAPGLSVLPDLRASAALHLLQAGLAVGLPSVLVLGLLRLGTTGRRRSAGSSRLLAAYSTLPAEEAAGRRPEMEPAFAGRSPGGVEGDGGLAA